VSDLSALIARLEVATGPDRAIDWEIHLRDGLNGVGSYGGHPAYTESIDATLTLVPDNWSWRVGNLPSGRGFADLGTQKSLQGIEGATPAIALCIAALRAREH